MTTIKQRIDQLENKLAPLQYQAIQMSYDESLEDFRERVDALPDLPGLTYIVIEYV